MKGQMKMNDLKTVSINKNDIAVKEYQGKRVVTLKDIDLCHNRPDGTAGRNFRTNKQHFIEGTDYFSITPDKFQSDEIRRFGISSPKGGIVITESGYLMLVKSFTDDLAWDVQRQLVNTYFRCKEEKTKPPYEYFDKMYQNEPVLTLEDVEHLTGIKAATINTFLKKHALIVWDYYSLKKNELKKFKEQNPKVSKSTSKVIIVSKSGFETIRRAYKLKTEMPQCFAPEQPEPTVDSPSISSIKDRLTAMQVLLDRLEELQGDNETAQSLNKRYAASICKTLTYLAAETDCTISKLTV